METLVGHTACRQLYRIYDNMFGGTLMFGLITEPLGLDKMHKTLWFCLMSG